MNRIHRGLTNKLTTKCTSLELGLLKVCRLSFREIDAPCCYNTVGTFFVLIIYADCFKYDIRN